MHRRTLLQAAEQQEYDATTRVPAMQLELSKVFKGHEETFSSFVYSSSGHKNCFVVLAESSIKVVSISLNFEVFCYRHVP